MSTQRRRVLANAEAGIPIDKISDGVYIEGLDGKAYKADDWQSGYTANSIAVASGDVKFRMALTQPSSDMRISSNNIELENYMTPTYSNEKAAKADYDGAGNTAIILKFYTYKDYAAGYCNAFTFPDGKTKGFLPSVGQLWLAYKNKAAVNAALRVCGGTAMAVLYGAYWSSTFWGKSSDKRYCWTVRWSDGVLQERTLSYSDYVRPFADIS